MSAPAPIPRPADEAGRQAALARYGVFETPAEEDFDFLTEMAATICGTPYSFIVLVGDNEVWFKSAHGRVLVGARPRDGDYCAWTILEPEGLHVRDLLADPRMAALPGTTQAGYRMYSGVNLQTADGHSIGTLCVLDTEARDLSPKQQELLRRLARQVMSLIELRAAQRELKRMVEELDRLARFDGLTGLLNRRALMEALETEFVRLSRYGGELSLVLLDIDHFKQINDHFGHPVGDEVLRGVGELLQRQLRTVDLAGRYGGEEFLLVLPHTGLAGAHVLATTLRARLAELKVTPLSAPVTASFGVAPVEPAYGIQAAIAAADQALYEAKAGGRDQVRLAVPVLSPATDEGG